MNATKIIEAMTPIILAIIGALTTIAVARINKKPPTN